MGRVGLEPTTNGLKGRCSTTELPTQRMRAEKLIDGSGGRKGRFWLLIVQPTERFEIEFMRCRP